jgi:hypothetical protein
MGGARNMHRKGEKCIQTFIGITEIKDHLEHVGVDWNNIKVEHERERV